VTDDEFLAESRSLSTSALRVERAHLVDASHVLVGFRARDRLWGVVLPLPSSAESKPWEYAPPVSARDSVEMLGVFLDEEVLTTAIESARSTDRDGVRFVELTSYGLRHSSDIEHARLSAI
jgi:hypothetical protein